MTQQTFQLKAAERLMAIKQLRIKRKNPSKPYFVLRYLRVDAQDKATGRIYQSLDKDHLVDLNEADKFKSRGDAKAFLDSMSDYNANDFYIEQIV